MIQSEQACDTLTEEQHLVSFENKDPEENFESQLTIRKEIWEITS